MHHHHQTGQIDETDPQARMAEAERPGQQPPGTGRQGHQTLAPMGVSLSDVETVQQRNAIEAISRAIQVCEFCADQCIEKGDPHMAACIRYCRDVSELGETALTLIPRNSRYADLALHAFTQAAEACARECRQHQDAHCQECANRLPEAMESVQQFQQFRS